MDCKDKQLNCKECGENVVDSNSLGYFGKLFTKNQSKRCHQCEAHICSKCADKYSLLIAPSDISNEDIEGKHEIKAPLNKKQKSYEVNEIFRKDNIQAFCFKCYCDQSTIDFSKTYEIIGPIDGAPVILAHGVGASRMMCADYANNLAKEKGYRCYLFDFPGHASLSQQPCTLENCIKVTRNIAELSIKQDSKNRKPLFIGFQFGGYIGFQVLANYPELFSAAIVTDCGIDFGPNKSCVASIGIHLMRKHFPKVTNREIMEHLIKTVPKQKDIDVDLVLKSIFQAGLYIQQSGNGIFDILEQIDVSECIPKFNGPIMFVNHFNCQDSEQKYFDLCVNKERSKLVKRNNDDFCPFPCGSISNELINEAIKFYETELQLNNKTN